jgi:HSP20 family molecular chaperone IbpA
LTGAECEDLDLDLDLDVERNVLTVRAERANRTSDGNRISGERPRGVFCRQLYWATPSRLRRSKPATSTAS